jgi:hypothetical protein
VLVQSALSAEARRASICITPGATGGTGETGDANPAAGGRRIEVNTPLRPLCVSCVAE